MRRFYLRFRQFITGLLHADLASFGRGGRALAYCARLTREATLELLASTFLMRASALAFSTLLALVPLVVVVTGVTAGLFPSQSDQLLDRVTALLVPASGGTPPVALTVEGGDAQKHMSDRQQQDVLFSARLALRQQLAGIRTHAKEINIIGFLVLFYTVLSLLDSIEESLNVLWHARKSRKWLEKLPYYSAILFLAPIFMVLSISLTTTLEAVGESAANVWLVPGWARGVPGFLLKHVTPVVLMTLALWATYLWMPSTNVRRGPSLAGALLAALGLEVLKLLFLVGAISVVRTNKIYGSLAVLPILFLWLYLSWVIVLCGAAVAFVAQNFDDITRKAERTKRGVQWRVYYALRIMLDVARRFRDGESPRIISDLAKGFDLPPYIVSGLCSDLVDRGVLAQVVGEIEAYVPARSLLSLTAIDVVEAAATVDLGCPGADSSPMHKEVAALLAGLVEARNTAAKVTLAELLAQAESGVVR